MSKTLLKGLLASSLLIPTLAFASPDAGHDDDKSEHDPVKVTLVMPDMDSELGRQLFADKGCATCHSVNGVGGEDASALDAHDMDPYMNPFELSAKMWRMAPFMIEAQETELGEQIQFTGEELAAIIAFLHDDEEQHEFTMESLTEEQRENLAHDD